MYGEYFDGQRCAEYCLPPTPYLPDCNDPETILEFWRKVDYVADEAGPGLAQKTLKRFYPQRSRWNTLSGRRFSK